MRCLYTIGVTNTQKNVGNIKSKIRSKKFARAQEICKNVEQRDQESENVRWKLRDMESDKTIPYLSDRVSNKRNQG